MEFIENNITNALVKRRSIRAYSDKQVTDEELDTVLRCGLYAPSGMNAQAPIFIAVRNKADRDLLSKLNAQVMGSDMDPFYNAPCVICVLSDADRGTAVEDGSLAIGNMCNAAYAIGLGSCWIHRCKEIFAGNEGKALLEKWGVKGNYFGVGFCILGHAMEEKTAVQRKENRVFYAD